MNRQFFVYIVTNQHNTVFYIGVTNNLLRRIREHKNKLIKGFTSKYNITKLVYYEIFTDSYSAISREKQLKNWHREWKINQIKSINPKIIDLYKQLVGGDPETSSG